MKNMYYWCNLQNGAKRTSGYIAARGATVGHKVEMIDLDGEFWIVNTVDPKGVTKEFVRTNQQKFKEFQGSLKGGGIQ
ncbi:hypothetical protein KA005_04615 [bacterium]|nr:hypothetical protein [bacterium]